MANNPPTTKKKRMGYRVCFIVLGGLLIWVFYIQGTRNMNAQAAIKSEADRETKKIQRQYDQLQAQLNTINQFVQHPPPGLTNAQVADVVKAEVEAIYRTSAGSGQSPSRNPATAPIQTYSAPIAPPLSPNSEALKEQGLELANEMNDWLRVMAADAPSMDDTFTPASSAEQEKVQAFTSRMQSEWREKFEGRATQMLGQLQKVGAITGMHNNCTVGGLGRYLLSARTSCAQTIQAGAQALK